MTVQDASVEARIWCPKCKVEKYEVRRVPTGSEGVYVHRIHPEGKGAQRCECGTMLERKEKK